MIIAVNAVTGEQTEFQIVSDNGKNNCEEFLGFICEYASKLRDEAAYK